MAQDAAQGRLGRPARLDPEDTFIAGVALTQVNLREQARVGEGEAQYYRSYRKYYQTEARAAAEG